MSVRIRHLVVTAARGVVNTDRLLAPHHATAFRWRAEGGGRKGRRPQCFKVKLKNESQNESIKIAKCVYFSVFLQIQNIFYHENKNIAARRYETKRSCSSITCVWSCRGAGRWPGVRQRAALGTRLVPLPITPSHETWWSFTAATVTKGRATAGRSLIW